MPLEANAGEKRLINKNNSLICLGYTPQISRLAKAHNSQAKFAYCWFNVADVRGPVMRSLPIPYQSTLLTKRKQVSKGRAGRYGTVPLNGRCLPEEISPSPAPRSIRETNPHSAAVVRAAMHSGWMGCSVEAQGRLLLSAPLSHRADQYTIRAWLYPHLINLTIRIACQTPAAETNTSDCCV